MATKIATYVFLVFALFSCDSTTKHSGSSNSYFLIYSLTKINSDYHNDTVVIHGYLQKYKPVLQAKGGGAQYFSYEFVFADSTKIPVRNKVLIDEKYCDKYVGFVAVIANNSIHNDTSSYQNTSKFWQVVDIIEIGN